MKYSDPRLRDQLAAEYVLGTLRGQARARFQSLMRYDIALRELVAEWENRLTPLAGAAADITPPPRVWNAIAQRLAPVREHLRWWENLTLWRGLAATGAVCTLVLALFAGTMVEKEPPMAMVAVMNDTQGKPAMTVSWPSMHAVRGQPFVKIKVMQKHPVMAPGTAWELWMLPRGDAKPVSLGLITTDADQMMRLTPDLARLMEDAWGIAMSVEPKGGSPSGRPTGPMVMQGPCVKIL